ncbi:MAG: ABC transporter ATP-binding protein [Granulicatella sp.]|nr:MAG: ABC transporter ATP-binding protein [Granulicatella sp.]
MLKTIFWLLSYIRYEKRSFFIGFILLLLASASGVYAPIVAKQFIDLVITPSENSGVINWGQITQFAVVYFGLLLISALSAYFGRFILSIMSNRLTKRLRDELFDKIQHLPIRYFDSLPAGKVVSKITNDTEVVRQNFFVAATANVLNSIIIIVGIYVVIFSLNIRLGAALLLVIPAILLWQVVFSKKAGAFTGPLRESFSNMNGKLNEIIQGMSIIQVFQQEKLVNKEYEEIVQEWKGIGLEELKVESFLAWSVVGFLRNVTLMFAVLYLSVKYLGGTLGLTAGFIYAIVDYINRLYDPIENLVQIFTGLQHAFAAGGRVIELMETPIEKSGDADFVMEDGKVEFKNVSFSYDGKTPVLKNISFTIEAGETVAFVGHTGSGKSTIMNLLFRFYDPTDGEIWIDHQNIALSNQRKVREKMGIVLQDPYLFAGTLGSNIGMENPAITTEVMENALIQVGGKHILERSEEGLDKLIQDKGAEYSSGERQLISFARALAFNPTILVLDEATSHVDTQTEGMIQQAMEVLSKDRTTVMIAHRLSTIVHADKIFVLDKGEIIEQGNHAELVEQDGMYAQMYRLQTEKN